MSVAPVNRFGMIAPDVAPLPLLGVRVTGEISGRCALVRTAQRYRNAEKTPLEVIYRFPLPEQAAVCGFRALVGDRVHEGVVEERERAFRDYDRAMQKGYGAFLLDQERPNIFTVSLGNLPPGGQALVELSWLMRLETAGDRYRFCLPTTIAPRYVSPADPDEEGIPAGEKVMPPYAPEVGYGLSLSLRLAGLPEKALIESPSHPVSIALTPGEAVVSLAADRARLDRDFVLSVSRTREKSAAWRAAGRRHAYYQLDVCLPEKEAAKPAPDRPREFFFLLDCSGSMAGDSIAQARRALGVCLRSLDAGCRFNVWRFGSNFEKLFERPRAYGEKTLADALERLADCEADLGGTELGAPLADACAAPRPADGEREIILLTDGQVAGEERLRQLVQGRGGGRLSVLGIGAAANDYLVATLARAGGGFHGAVFPGEDIERKTIELFSRLRAPAVSNLRVAWPGAEPDQAPAAGVFSPGRPETVFCRVPLEETPPSSLAVTFRRAGRREKITVPVGPADPAAVRPAWAREAIRDLEEATTGGSLQEQRRARARREQAIALSCEYGVISSHTSMVAVEKRPPGEAVTGPLQLRRVPALPAAGWHGRGRLGVDSCDRCFLSPAIEDHPAAFLDTEESSDDRFIPDGAGMALGNELRPCRRPAARASSALTLTGLLAAQEAAGGFRLSAPLARACGFTLARARAAARRLKNGGGEDPFRLVSTALVLAILENRFAGERTTWEPLTAKSRRWLDKVIGQHDPQLDGQPLADWARAWPGKHGPAPTG